MNLESRGVAHTDKMNFYTLSKERIKRYFYKSGSENYETVKYILCLYY